MCAVVVHAHYLITEKRNRDAKLVIPVIQMNHPGETTSWGRGVVWLDQRSLLAFINAAIHGIVDDFVEFAFRHE